MKKVMCYIWGKIKHYFCRSPQLKEVVMDYGDMVIKMNKTGIEIFSKRDPGKITLI